MANKLQPISTHPWLVKVEDAGYLKLRRKGTLYQIAFPSKLEAEYAGIELQSRFSCVEGSVSTDIIDREDNEVWETFSHYDAKKSEDTKDFDNGTFVIPENLTENEMLWLISNPTESLQKHRAQKAKELKRIEALKAKNSKPKTR